MIRSRRSAAYDYTFNITTKNAVAGNKLSVASKTSGSKVTVKTQPSGTALTTSHTFVISVPASTLTDEPESAFDIMADGNKVGGFAVKQAKKPSISVDSPTVWGGTNEVRGLFTASTWDLKSSGYVTSSNSTNMPILSPNKNGTFTVGMAASIDHTFINRSATITLVGVTGNLATCSIAQNKFTYEFSNSSGPTESLSFSATEGSDALFVTTTELGDLPGTSYIEVESSETWCRAIVETKSNIQIIVDRNTEEKARTAVIRLKVYNCLSQPVTITQEAAVTLKSLTPPAGCVYSNNTLSAYSTAKTYDFTLGLNIAVDASKISIARTSGSLAVPTLTTTGSKTSHTVRVSVPASTLTTEPESVFDIKADGNRIGSFTVKQAKKPSISVSTPTVWGGVNEVSGSFTASTWDLKSSGYVTSSNSTNMPILSPNKNGTFTVGMAASIDHTFINRSATITLVGVTGNLATCSIAQNKFTYEFSNSSGPTESLSFSATGGSDALFFTTTELGNPPSTYDIHVESSETWCHAIVKTTSGIQIDIEGNTGTERTALIRLRINNCWSQPITVTQDSDGPATVTIGGAQWTMYNVDTPGTVVASLPSALTGNRADSHGKFYQWNRKVAWATTGSSVSGWDTSTPSGTSWGSSTNPCPSGFVVPTKAQWDALISACTKSYKGGWSSSDYGYLELKNGSNTLEFPAVGIRNTSGTLVNNGTYGYYWSSTQYSSIYAYYMVFNNSSVNPSYNYNKRYGFSVRCVRR